MPTWYRQMSAIAARLSCLIMSLALADNASYAVFASPSVNSKSLHLLQRRGPVPEVPPRLLAAFLVDFLTAFFVAFLGDFLEGPFFVAIADASASLLWDDG